MCIRDRFGDGPPIILLHGVSNSSKTWNNISKKLSKIRTVYLIDFRGHGNSDHFDNYEWINFSNDIVAFIEKNIDSKVEIIGHSLGACVATKVSQILKTNIKALILEDPPFFTHKRQGEKGISQRFQHNLHLSKKFNSKNKILEKLKNNSKLSNVKNLELISENLANLDYKVLEATINGEALKSFHPEEILPEISGIRTLLLAGDEIWYYAENDFYMNNETSFRVAKGLQNSSSPYLNYWEGGRGAPHSLFVGLRDCNIFLENLISVPGLEEEERQRWLAEVKVLKALFVPLPPITLTSLDSSGVDTKSSRPS